MNRIKTKLYGSIFFLLLSTALSAQIQVGVLPVVDRDGSLKYGVKLMLTSSITSAISATSGYEAYDRIDLSSVLDEQAFQRTGNVNESEIHRLGEMTGVSYVLITEAAAVDNLHLIATAKIVNVETAHIDGSAVKTLSTDPSKMLEECKELATELLGNNKDAGFLDIDGCKYKGETLGGKPHGRGIMYYPEVDSVLSFEGTFVNGAVKQGLMTFRDGEIYEGEFGNGKFNGYGIRKDRSGNQFKGFFKNGKADGYVEVREPDGTVYIGDFKNGQAEGTGEQIWASGLRYKGGFAHSKINGYGILYYPEGPVYSGYFVDGDQTDGKITFGELSETQEYFEGHWENGKWNGKGHLRLKNGDYWEGTWVNDKMEGEAEYNAISRAGYKEIGIMEHSKWKGVVKKYDRNGKVIGTERYK